MFFYKKALMDATYVNGTPGTRTQAHERAEFHRFKTDYLFKTTPIPTAIPKKGYVSRLIQQLLIMETIEKRLQSFSAAERTEISAFFALSYLDALWRSPGMNKDLAQLNHERSNIQPHEIAKSTQDYIKHIEQLPPKQVLAHFLVHVAGFMHGGSLIRSKYIFPSNAITKNDYEIATNQYDFINAGKNISYNDLMTQLDKIPLDETEYKAIFHQSTQVYEVMSQIYDDLWKMHIHHPQQFKPMLAVIGVCLVALVLFLKLFNTSHLEYQSPSL